MNSNRFNIAEFVKLARELDSDTAEVEVKTAAGGLPKDIVETISAFANCSGGTIVCGLSEKEGFIPAEGFDAKKISEALSQACTDKMEPPVRADVHIERFEGAFLVVAGIPETEPFLKPCYVKARGPYDGSFFRTGEGDRKLSRYEVDRLTEERQQPRYDACLVVDGDLSDFDNELVEGFLRRERAASPRVFSGLPDEDALLTMGVIGKDESGVMRPTLAGLMALGRHPQKYFPRANVTFAVFPTSSKEGLSAAGARFLDSKTVIGSIPVMVAETIMAVRRNMKVTSYVEGAARADVPEYPEVAIREAVANALMHRDYSPEGLGSQVQVNMYPDRIEIISPGGLYGAVTVDNIGEYGASSSRNQFLSRVLESAPYPEGYPERGYVVENKGTGFAQIQSSLRAAGMEPPIPKDNVSLFALTIRNERTKGLAAESALVDGLSKEKRTDGRPAVVDVVRAKGSITTSEAASVMGVSTATAYRRLKKLVDEGILKPSGQQGRSTKYELA